MKEKTSMGEGKGTNIWSFLYETPLGRRLLKPICSPGVSKFVGAVLDTRVSLLLVPFFVKKHHIDMSEYESRFYSSYNEFFARKLKKEKRPIDREAASLISPCDGNLMLYPIEEDLTMPIKNSVYSVSSLLRSKELSKQYEGGTAVVIRLTGEDYHHYCYAASGKKGKGHYLHGFLHAADPVALERIPVYKENAREFCRIRTKYFGEMIQMEVGAMLVGKICNDTDGIRDVEKGEEKGHFELGGSTVILLMQKDTVDFDDDLLENSQQGLETKVKMGERIGYRRLKDDTMKYFSV